MSQSLFYHDKPVFGLDIGSGSVKAMQMDYDHNKGRMEVLGYGLTNFDSKVMEDGVITDYRAMAKPIHDLFSHGLVGGIGTRRVILSIPTARAFSRILNLPLLNRKALNEAVRLEAEQYIPVPINDLYIDYEQVSDKPNKDGLVEILVVAAPRKIVDAYLNLMKMLDLEVVAIETNLSASTRLISLTENKENVPTLLIDVGSESIDISVLDKSLRVTGTVTSGGNDFTKAIASQLQITPKEANAIKAHYGLAVSKHQQMVKQAVTPIIDQLIKEVQRLMRYYSERINDHDHIQQVITMGGGANMPGLSDYLTEQLRMPVRQCSPWQMLSFGKLQPPHDLESSMYITVAGLALVDPKGVYGS